MKKHTKEIKQFIAILLASVMVAAYVVPSYADDSILQDNVKEQTETIENSEENVPTPGAALAPTEQPVVTQQPTESQEQEETIQESTPEATAQPEETNAPVEEPVATEIPEENPVPEVTPEVPEQPQSTEQPGEIVVPTATPESAPTIEPAVTEQPVVIPSASPEGTPTCAPSETPAGLDESSPSVSPEITPSVSPECTPSISPTPSGTPTASATPTATPEAYTEPMITFACQDEEGMLLGTEQVPEFEDSLSLESAENAPIAIEGYTYINAELDGTVIVKLTKTIKEIEKTTEAIEDEEVLEETVAENSVETIVLWSYVTEDGETIQIEEDTEITLNYEEDEVVVSVNATCVDSFGDEISAEYTQIELPEFTMDYLLLDDADIPPVENVQVRTGLFKVTKYTYVQATIDKEIIKALKRTVAKDTQDSTEKEYIYSYTTDGTTWNKIKKDTTVYFVYSDGKKTTYTYEDSNVSVVATLQHANAIPDDAQFIVTPITPESNGYNYDAYMEALNENVDVINPEGAQTKGADDKYTEENTLLYDIAFLAPAVDENGDMIEGEMVEYQPAEGMVNISFTFKKSQISEGLDVTEAKEVSVVHLPLVDSVREQNATTEQATDITAKDIKIEVVEGAISLEGSEDKADFNLSDFSVMAVTADGEGSENPTLADENYTLEYLLRSYNIVALGDLQVEQHTVGAIMVMGDMNGTSNNNLGQDAKAPSYIGGTKNSPFYLFNGSSQPLYVGSSNTITYPVENTQQTYVNGVLTSYEKNVFENPNYVDSAKLKTAISGTMTGMQQQSTAVYNVSGTESGSPYQIPAGSNVTLKLNGQQAYLSLEGININNTEPTVINILDTGTVYLPQITGLELSGDSGANMSIVFNIPNASKVILQGDGSPKIGHVVAPQADINAIGSNYNGCLIGKSIYTTAEGHMYPYTEGNGSLVKPTFNELGASKTVDGNVPTAEQVFSFGLDVLENGAWKTLETVSNNRGEILFNTINYNAAGTYWYRVYEVQNESEDYTLSTTQYVLKAVVTETNGSFTVQNTYYKVTGSDASLIDASALISGTEVDTGKLDSALSGRSEVSFDNKTKNLNTGSINLTKIFSNASGLTDVQKNNISFTITGPNNYNKTYTYAEMTGSENRSILIENIPVGDYTIVENNASVPGYSVTTTYQVLSTQTNDKAVATVTKDSTIDVNISNAYQEKLGTLTLQKSYSGVEESQLNNIVFRVVDSNGVERLYKSYNQFENGIFTLSNLPPGKYTVIEQQADINGYTCKTTFVVNGESTEADSIEIDFADDMTVEIVNEYTSQGGAEPTPSAGAPETVDLSVTKKWVDEDNSYKKRPDYITIHVYKNNNVYVTNETFRNEEDTTSDTWEYTFTGLPKYDDKGAEIEYTIQELNVDGYTSSIEGDAENGFTVTNTYVPETVSVKVTKAWSDNNNTYQTRPDSVSVQLKANGANSGEAVTLTQASNNWTYTWTDLPKYDNNGSAINYTVEEVNYPGNYSSSLSGNATDGYVITNTLKTIDISGSKTWVDKNNAYGIRPNSIVVHVKSDDGKVSAQQTVNAGAGDIWNYSFTGLPEYDSQGNKITYTITEDPVPGYVTTVNGYNITNTIEVISIPVTKAWNDNDDALGNRPDSVTVKLMKNGNEQVGDSQTLNDANNWTHTFTELQKYDAQRNQISYTVVEENIATGYSAVVTGDATNGYVITNNYTPGYVSRTVNKVWKDGENKYHTRPESIKVQLYANNEAYGDEVTLNSDGGWSHTWTDLPETKNGETVAYTVQEVSVPTGYEANVTQLDNTFTITNTLKTTNVSGSKTWIDGDNTQNRPASITIYVKNGDTVVDSKDVTASDNWSWSFEGLPAVDANGDITYTIEEAAVNGYTTKVEGYNVTNTINQETLSISGTKTWVDPAGTVHPTITINLLQDNEEIQEISLENGNTTYEFTDLPKYDLTDGHEYVYKITEDAVEGYTTTQSGNDFTNTINQTKISVSGTKTWVDPEGTVHPDITIHLLQDGNKIKEVTLQNGTTTYTFADLDKYAADGHEYEYTVTEDAVECYTTEQTGNNFKNTIKQESIDISGTKTWVDPAGTEHPTVTIELWRDGAPYKETTIANGESNYSFNDLDKYDLANGHEYQYTVQEVTVDGYVTTRDGNNFTNTISQDSVSVSGDKTWIAPADTVHPAITINLLQNGVEIAEKTLPNGVTSYSFENLDKYAPDGSEYVYTVTENPVEGYTTLQTGNNFTNTINQVEFDINGTKKWIDPAGTTHETITIHLLQDGNRINSVQLKDGETSYSFEALDKYADDGHVYEYTVEEDVVSGYTTKIEGYQITNTINQEQITVSGVKTWIDPEGTEHPTIKVNLYRDGTLLQTRSLADGNVNYSFENLDKYAPDGHVYSYTVSEENIEGYTASYEGYNITNTINQKYTSVNGTKTWVAPEGTVYPEITIHLLQDGEEYRETKLASGVTNYEFTNLPVYDLTDGHVYEYTVEEEALADYTGVQNGFDFTNTIKQQTFDISGTKTWLDEDGNAQPEDTVHPTVTIQLLRDGSVIDTKELPSGTTEYQFENLDMYDVNTGHEYAYTVQEVPVDGYLSTQSGYDFINKASADKVNISGIKTWVAPAGTEYPEITIHLFRDGEKVDSVTLPSGTTTYSFTELDKYAPDSHLYVYTVEEEPVEGYTTEQVGFNFKNTIEQTYIDVSGIKTWVDPEGTIHPTITVNLLKDGTKVDSVQLQNGETEYSFTNLEKYDLATGREYVYTIKEDAISGYTTTYNGNEIINTIAQETMSVNGTKTWIAPEGTVYPEITVNLLQNGTKIASKTLSNGTVEYSFDGLSKYDADGHAYVYTIEEEPVTGYTGEVSGYNLVNTIKQEKISVSGTKTWVDPEGTVHPTITICLMRDTQLYQKVELEDGETQYSFTDLDKYDLTDGHVYEYTVEEETVDGYATTYNGTEIINTIEQEKTSISGTKTWVAPEGTVYPEITINLLRDGVEVDEITLTNGATSYSFTDLAMYDLTETKDGHKYVYTVTEDALPGYTSQQNGTDFVNTYIQPSASPTAEPTAEPSATPTAEPTATPGATAAPTAEPSATPGATEAPTAEPSATPGATAAPTAEPTATPGATEAPTAEPSATPGATAEPTVEPSATPTTDPSATATPTAKPTSKPTAKPTSKPTSKPTATPAKTATPAPTATATVAPTAAPTATIVPTPSSTPVVQPTDAPVIVERPQRTPTLGGGSDPTIEVDEPNTEPRILEPVRVEEPSVKGAVRGARRGLEAAVLGRRRRPVTGDSLALLLWIMTFSVAFGTAVTSGIMMTYEKGVKKKQRIK